MFPSNMDRIVLFSLIHLLVLFRNAQAAGSFQLELIHYSNPDGKLENGKCCGDSLDSSCPSSYCQVYPKICLQSYKNPELLDVSAVDADSCPYGSTTGSVIPQNGLVRETIGFNFSWPGSTTLIFELCHLSDPAGADTQLIKRAVELVRLDATDGWKTIDASDKHLSLTFRVRIACEQDYFGPACNIQCKAADDSNRGHYNCSSVGTKLCHEGWGGANCDSPICSEDCGGPTQGKCVAPNTCQCRYGWQGDKCDACIPYEGCDHGYCNKPFECVCEERWGGLQCDKDLDYCMHHRPCKNGATCIPHAPDNYTCVCDSNHSGRDCEIQTSPCWSNPCQNFGTCVVVGELSQCICDQFHSGSFCEKVRGRSDEVETTAAAEIEIDSDDGVFEGRPCFYQGRYHPHLSGWKTTDCRTCNCIEGRANCSAANCQPDNCLPYPAGKIDINGPSQIEMSPTAIQNPRCPPQQVCHSITSPQCLKGPCLEFFGQCVPWDLIIPRTKRRRCHETLDLGLTDSKCSRFYMALDEQKLKQGATVEGICYDLVLLILTKQLEHYTTDCRLNSINPLVVEVNLISVRQAWPTRQLRDILMETIRQNLTMSHNLRAAERVALTVEEIHDKKQFTRVHVQSTTSTQAQWMTNSDYSPAIYSIAGACLLIIALLMVVACVLYKVKNKDDDFSFTPSMGKCLSVNDLQSVSADTPRWNNDRSSPIYDNKIKSSQVKNCNLWQPCASENKDKKVTWFEDSKFSTIVDKECKVATVKPALRTIDQGPVWEPVVKAESGHIVTQVEASV